MKDFFLILFGYVIRFIYEKFTASHPKVVFNIEEAKGFNVPMPAGQPNLHLWQHSIHLCNWGKIPATDVVVSHSVIPFHINISPHAIRKINTDRDANTITITSIAPRELITISYLDFVRYNSRNVHNNITYREGVAREIPLLITRYPNKWLVRCLLFFALIGVVVSIWFCWSKLPEIWQGLKP